MRPSDCGAQEDRAFGPLWTGRPLVYGAAALVGALWLLTGPVFNLPDLMRLAINAGGTALVVAVAVLLRRFSARTPEPLQEKLDALIRVTQDANEALGNLDDLSEEDLGLFRAFCERLAARARHIGEAPETPAKS